MSTNRERIHGQTILQSANSSLKSSTVCLTGPALSGTTSHDYCRSNTMLLKYVVGLLA